MNTLFKSRSVHDALERLVQYPQNYLGTGELAAVIGCSNPAISQQLNSGNTDLPTPLARIGVGPVWAKGQIKEWLNSQTA